jgi:hypothetical protein
MHSSFRTVFGTFPTQSVVIPVVVHVVYNTNDQKITKQQVLSQIPILNDDYSMKNHDINTVPAVFKTLIANTGIQFEMAKIDPKGNPTDGIEYVKTNVNEFVYTDSCIKFSKCGGADIWPRDKYLNIWVCNLSGGVLGCAQFPGGPAATDGVVIHFKAYGTGGVMLDHYDKGRTATHEIGHWFDLFHIWGDDGDACTGSDQVKDTPNQANANGGCPVFPHVTCDNAPNGDLFMNYMDYVDDTCMKMFTKGQVQRMQLALYGPRSSFLKPTTSNALRTKSNEAKARLNEY